MRQMTLENIAKVCHGTYVGEPEFLEKEVEHIVIDSRKIGTDDLFVAIKGERADGHSFIAQVMQQGALAVISEQKLEAMEGPYILVGSSTQALKDMAVFYRSVQDIKVVGITGSVGKTSTKEMIASVLKQRYKVHKTAGNFNNEIGLPLTVFGITQEHQVAVLEMGISDFGEMHRLAAIATPDIGVITNIGLCHLENLGTRDGILKAKTEMLDHIKEDGTVILNGDDDKLGTVEDANGRKIVFYGMEHGDAYVKNVENLGFEGIRMTLHVGNEEVEVQIPIPGEHNIYNALAAACVGHTLGLSIEEIKAGIESVEIIGGRSNFIKKNEMTIIDDCYNANPVSMCASIDVLEHARGRSIAVLGDMGELGAEEKQLHYQVGVHFSQSSVQVLFTAGTLSQEISRAVRDKNTNQEVYTFETRDQMVSVLKNYVKKGDTILVKASHFMEFSKVVAALKDASDFL